MNKKHPLEHARADEDDSGAFNWLTDDEDPQELIDLVSKTRDTLKRKTTTYAQKPPAYSPSEQSERTPGAKQKSTNNRGMEVRKNFATTGANEEAEDSLKGLTAQIIRILRRRISKVYSIFSTLLLVIVKYIGGLSKLHPKRAVIIGSLITLPILLIIIGVFVSGNQRQKIKEQSGQTLPATFIKESSQKLYNPTVLPEGYKINISRSVNEEILTAFIITNGTEEIALSQQSDIPEDAFLKLFKDAETIETSNGTAYVKKSNVGVSTAGIRLEKTTVLLNTSSPIETDTIKTLFGGLRLTN